MKTKFMLAAVAAVLISGCSGNDGKEYLGDWVHPKLSRVMLKIERNGENFMLRQKNGSEVENFPAKFKDGMLHVDTGWGQQAVMIDKTTGNLTGGSINFKRP